MGLYHSEFLVKNKKKFSFLFLGLIWIIGISLCITVCFDDSMTVINIGDCHTDKLLFVCLYVAFSIISLIILIFSVIKIYLNLRKIDDTEDLETKAYKKKLFILGTVKAFEILLYPLYFTLRTNPIITSLRITVQICTSFAFIVIYSYDDQFGETMKEFICCKKEVEPNIHHNIIYGELKQTNTDMNE